MRSFFDSDFYRYVVGLNGDFNFKDNAFISRFGYDTGSFTSAFNEPAHRQRVTVRFDPGCLLRSRPGNFNPFIGQNAPLHRHGRSSMRPIR